MPLMPISLSLPVAGMLGAPGDGVSAWRPRQTSTDLARRADSIPVPLTGMMRFGLHEARSAAEQMKGWG